MLLYITSLNNRADSLRFKHLNDSLSTVIKKLEKDDLTIKYINAVGAQWPFLLIIVFCLLLLFYRKKIGQFLGKTKSFKGAAAGVSLEIVQNENASDSNVQSEDVMNSTVDVIGTSSERETDDDKSNREPILFDTYVELSNGNQEEANVIFNKIQEKAIDALTIEKNKLVFQYFKYANGDINSINELIQIRELSSNIRIKSTADYYIALCYVYSQNFEKALDFGMKAMELSRKENMTALTVDQLLGLSDAFLKSEKQGDYIKLLFTEIERTADDEELFRLFRKIADLHYDDGRHLESLAFLLKANSFISNDIDVLFKIAYSASQLEYNELSLQFYDLRNKLKVDSAATENNLGVAYDKLQVKSKAIEFFKKSYKHGNTLGASNLVFKHINNGFWDEAKEILNDIKINYTDIHSNIWKAYDRLEEDTKIEKEKLDDIYKKSLSMRAFFNSYTLAKTSQLCTNDKQLVTLKEYTLENSIKDVNVDNAKLTLAFELDNSILTITFPKKLEITGECFANDYYIPGQTFKSDSYKGLYCFIGNKIHVMLKYEYYHTKQEMHFFVFIEKELVLIENQSLT